MKSRLIPVSCPICGYTTMRKKETYVVAAFDSHLKEQLLSGEYFRFHCPRCHSDSTYAHPMLYYDAQKHFVVMLNEKAQETSFQPDVLCVQVHTSEDFAEHLHILEDDLLPAQILAIKRPLQQRYPHAVIRYDCKENDALWFICQMEDAVTMVGVKTAGLGLHFRNPGVL